MSFGFGFGIPSQASASGGATLSLNFAGATSLDPKITFTRASTGSYYGSNGLLASAATNAPRFDYDPVTLQPKGLLIEEQRTNLLTYSEQFDNAAWTSSFITVTANSMAAPDGTITADTLTTTTALNAIRPTTDTTVLANTIYTFSFYAYRGTATDVKYSVYNVTGASDIVASTSYFSQIAVGSWSRITVTFTTPAGCTSIRVFPIRDSGVVGSIYLWGAQLEAGAFATSYIPTVAAQVTRAADNAVMTGTNFSSWFNATEGTFAASGAPVTTTPTPYSFIIEGQNPLGTAATISIGVGGTSSNFGVDIRQTAGGISGNQTIPYSFNPSTPFKAAGAYLTGTNGGIAFNGAIITPNLVDPQNTATSLNIGNRGNSTNYWNGWVRNVTYWPRRLSNAELQSVTA